MNRLIVKEERIIIDNEAVEIEYTSPKVNLEINGNVMINDFNNKIKSLNIKINKDSNLLYNKYNNDSQDLDINIFINDKSKVEFNYSLVSNNETKIVLNSNLLGNDNDCVFNACGIANKAALKVYATGSVLQNIQNNKLLENIRILTLGDFENVIVPNLLVGNNEVLVNHNATISSIDKEYIYYMNSKGISTDSATKLLVQGFLKKYLKIKEKEVEFNE